MQFPHAPPGEEYSELGDHQKGSGNGGANAQRPQCPVPPPGEECSMLEDSKKSMANTQRPQCSAVLPLGEAYTTLGDQQNGGGKSVAR